MEIVLDEETGEVWKRALTDAERRRLTHEAEVLRMAAHPGVVEVVETVREGDVETLVLRRVQGPTLSGAGRLAPTELAWIGAALATTVGDLHDIGVVHLALEPDHVLIDADGRPVLCGFGSARCDRGVSPEDRHRFESLRQRDVTALAKLLIEAGGESLGGRPSSTLATAAQGRRRKGMRGRPNDARDLAEILAAAASEYPEQRGGRRRDVESRSSNERLVRSGARPTSRVLVGSAIAVCIAVAAALLTSGRARPATVRQRQQGERTSSQRPCPAEDDGCSPIVARDGLIAPGFRVLGIAGVTVIGRWDCRPVATPAVLDLRTGMLWVFDSWPASGQQSVGRLVAATHEGSTLKVIPAAGQGSCDQIEILDRGHALAIADPRVPIHQTKR